MRNQKHLDYDNIGIQNEPIGLIVYIRNILWSCWYVIEDLWRLIAPTITMILRLIWRLTKPALNFLWLYVKKQTLKHPAGASSIALHIILLLLLAGGLPSCEKEKKITPPQVITLDLLPIKKITNIKPKNIEKPAKPQAVPKSPVKKIAGKPKPPKKPISPKKITKKPTIKKPVIKPKSTPKVKPRPKKPTITHKAAELNKLAKATKPKQLSTNYNPEIPLSISEIDFIRNQLVKCWRILPGAKDVAKIAVTVNFKLHKDGSVNGVININDKSRYSRDPIFKAAADNAVRAVLRCSPLKNLPKEKYKQWKEMEFNFDPREMY